MIDSIRMGLMGLLPLASAGGIFLLFQEEEFSATQLDMPLPLGLFTFAITLGLFAFEVYGIKKCRALSMTG